MVGGAVALLSQPRPDLLLDAAVRHRRPPRARPDDRRRDRARSTSRSPRSLAVGTVALLEVLRRSACRSSAASARRCSSARSSAPSTASSLRALRPALARRDARHDGRLPRPRLHHRLGDRLHRFRRTPISMSGRSSSSGRSFPSPSSSSSLRRLAVGFLMHRRSSAGAASRSATTRTPPGSPASTWPRLKIAAYALAGGLAGVAALVWIGQYGSARGDNADG